MKHMILLACVFLLSGFSSTLQAAVPYNPPPCTEDFKCVYPPSATGSVSGPTKVCVNKDGSWYVDGGDIVVGKKQKCQQPMVDVNGSISWSWSLSGPESDSGSGKTASHKPTKCGDYSITFTGKITTDSPCQSPSDVTLSKSFSVSKPVISGEVRLPYGADSMCPDDYKYPELWLTNSDANCDHVVKWTIGSETGDPTIAYVSREGSYTVPAGETVQASIIQSHPAKVTKRGVKTIVHYLYADCDVDAKVTWQQTVKAPDLTIDLSDKDLCVSDVANVSYSVTSAACKESITWQGTLDPGPTTVTATPLSGAGDTTVSGTIAFTCPINSPPGKATYKMAVSIDPLGEVITKTATYTVPEPKINAGSIPAQGCPGDVVMVKLRILNDGLCKEEEVQWTAAWKSGELVSVQNPSGTVVVASGVTETVEIPVLIPENAEPNNAIIKITARVPRHGPTKDLETLVSINEKRWHCGPPPQLRIDNQHQSETEICPGTVDFGIDVTTLPGLRTLECGKTVYQTQEIVAAITSYEWTVDGVVDPTFTGMTASAELSKSGDHTVSVVVTSVSVDEYCPIVLTARADFTVHVHAPKADTAHMDNVDMCPSEYVSMPWVISNTGECYESFNVTWKSTLGKVVGVSMVDDFGNLGFESGDTIIVPLYPGQARHGYVSVLVPNPKDGTSGTVTMTIRARDEEVTIASATFNMHLSVEIHADKQAIMAGGKDNETDKTIIRLKVDCGSSQGGSSQAVTVTLVNGLGTQFMLTKTFGNTDIDVGGHHPARLVGSGLELTGGEGNSGVLVAQPGVEYELVLYSSNLVGDSSTIRVSAGGEDFTSQKITFNKAAIKFTIIDNEGVDVTEGPFDYFQMYRITAHETFNNRPVTLHETLMSCERYTRDGAGDIVLDQDADGSVSIFEFDRMNERVFISKPFPVANDAQGKVIRLMRPAAAEIKELKLKIVDTTIVEEDSL